MCCTCRSKSAKFLSRRGGIGLVKKSCTLLPILLLAACVFTIRILWALPRLVHSTHGPPECSFTIYVLLHKRPANSKLLLDDLNQSLYGNNNDICLHILIDRDKQFSQEYLQVVDIAKGFQWRHGLQRVTILKSSLGIVRLWLSLGRDCANDSMFAVFEDDLRVSPIWFTWTMVVKKKYFNSQWDAQDIFGLSLAPIRIIEMEYPYAAWDSTKRVSLNVSVFMHNLPSSWGPIFRCSEWKGFLSYADKRWSTEFRGNETSDPVRGGGLGDGNFFLPNHFSNLWNKSWKRMLIEYCHLLGKVVIYPNILGQAGFVTNLHLSGVHAKARKSNDHKTCPLLMDTSIDSFRFPAKEDLDIFDQHCHKTTRELLIAKGNSLRHSFLALGEPYSSLLSNATLPGESHMSGMPILFNCPERKSLYYQWVKVIDVLLMAQQVQMNALMPHMIVNTGVGLEFVPFSEVFSPPSRVGEVHVRIATHYNLKLNKPNKIMRNNDEYEQECEQYFNIWGSSDIEYLSLHQTKARYEYLSSEWIAAGPGMLSEKLFSQYPKSDIIHLRKVLTPNERTRMLISHVEGMLAGVSEQVCISTLGCHSQNCKKRLDHIVKKLIETDKLAILLEYSDSSWLNIGENIGTIDILHRVKKWCPLMSEGVAAATATFVELHVCLKAKTIFLIRNSSLDYLLSVVPSNSHLIYL